MEQGQTAGFPDTHFLCPAGNATFHAEGEIVSAVMGFCDIGYTGGR